MGWPFSLSPSGFREVGWGILFVWQWLLCSWHLSPFPVPTSPPIPCLPFLHYPLPVLHGTCTGLSVCACMCAPVYTCIERDIFIRARGKRGVGGVKLRACSQDTAHWSLSSAPSMLVRLREGGRRALVRPDCPGLLPVTPFSAGRFFRMIGQMMDSPPPFSLYSSLYPSSTTIFLVILSLHFLGLKGGIYL